MPMFTMHIKLEGAKYMNTGIIFYPRLENKLKKWFEMNFETGFYDVKTLKKCPDISEYIIFYSLICLQKLVIESTF